MSKLERQILDFVQQNGYQPLKPKNLAKKLGVVKKKLPKYYETLDRLQDRGELRVADSGRIQARIPAGLIPGILRKRSSGVGFLIPHDPAAYGITGDVYIAPEHTGDAHNADEVLVRLLDRRRRGGQRCGVVADVVERATNTFVGRYFEEGEQGYVQIDGRNFTEPVWVGDPGAKGAQTDDKVVIEMIRFPSQRQQGEAVLTEVLGPRGEPGVDTLTVIHEFGLRDEFPEEVLAEARIEAENFREQVLDGREDLTKTTMVTIDPADARDFDDAISLSRTPDGHWHLGVHIADVAHFVQPGSALDREAQLRGTSVYLPTKVIPMLPEVISNSLASLQQRRVRYTRSVLIEFNPEGIPVHTRFANTAIRVNKRLSYEEVLPIIEQPDAQRGGVPGKVRKLLCDMHELAMLLRRRRFQQGALDMAIPEIKLEFDARGRVSGAAEQAHDESHQIIEEFMLAANIAVATELADRGIPYPRRVHGEPSPIKLREFAEFAAIMGHRLKKPQSRSELRGLLQRVKGRPEERALNYALLRSMKQAEYSPLDIGHYALAEQNYCHFTSPIRRYPDLMVHRLIDALLTASPAKAGSGSEELLRLSRHCSMTERQAQQAERELTTLKLLAHLESRVGEELDAVISGVDRYGFFARGVELPAEGLVHVGTLSEFDVYDYDRPSMALVGRRTGEQFRLGDPVRVTVVRVDVDRREVDFRLVRGTAAGQRKSRPAARKRKSDSHPAHKATRKKTRRR